MPYVEVAKQSLGQTHAPDLQAQVDDGSMTEEAARELTKARLRAYRAEAERDTTQQQTAAQQTQATADAVRGAVATWEQGIRARDPDYARMELNVQRTARGLIAEHGAPNTPAAAVALVERAYDEVRNLVKAAQPPRPPTRQTPASHSASSHGAMPVPNSMREAIQQAIQRGV